MRVKFLFVTSTIRDLVNIWVCQETSNIGSLFPPIDLAGLAAVVNESGGESEIVDLRLAENLEKMFRDTIETFKPDAVVVNLCTPSANRDYELMKLSPERVKRICFGTHATALPQEALSNGFHFVLIGDPEACLKSLIEHEMDGENSPGVLTKTNFDKKPLLSNLETLPFPALELIDLDKYYIPFFTGRFSIILGSRGCPFPCTFCTYPVFFGRKARDRSVKSLIEEIEKYKKDYSVNKFIFLDATFNISVNRVEEFCRSLINEKLDIEWTCNLRVNPLTGELLALMKKAGCVRVFFGVEDLELSDELKKGITETSTKEAFQMAKKAGIKTVAFLMLFPRENTTEKEYKKKILRILNELRPDAFQLALSIPFPGTELYEKYKEEHQLTEEWNLFDPGGNRLPYSSDIDLVKLKKNIYLEYALTHPKFILGIIQQVRITNFIKLSKPLMRLLAKN